jgi:hypothetical protein
MNQELDKNLNTFFDYFENWVLADIRLNLGLQNLCGEILPPDRETRNIHRPFVASVILVCCAIDCLAAFRYGRENSAVGRTFNNFVKTYFKAENTKSRKTYDQNKVYNGLRNALVHGYSLGNDLALKHTDENSHLLLENGRVIVDVYSLYYDLESVYEKYKLELQEGQNLAEFSKRWQAYPLIQSFEMEEVKR